MKKVIDQHRARKGHAKKYLSRAVRTSYKDLKKALSSLGHKPKPSEMVNLIKILSNSGIWLSRSMLRYLTSQVDFSINKDGYKLGPSDEFIIEAINRGEQLNPEHYSDQIIFETIFNDLEFAHHNHLYETKLRLPKTNVTMALVSGVFNEIFSTPAFARGADHLNEATGLKSIFLKASGTKGIGHNSSLIYKQLKKYVTKHPDEKIWLVAFSKGGVDALHFMHQHHKFCEQHVLGLSNLATPILGTNHLEKKVVKGIHLFDRYAFTVAYKKLTNKYEFLDDDFQKALSYDFQGEWFKKNHQQLPKCFYTALGFEAKWYESHLWMVLTKLLLQSQEDNDGVVDTDSSQFPDYFNAHNFGILKGHHLIGARSSFFSQEALLEAHLIYLRYRGLI